MELQSFRVKNFRSITDSGDIELSHVTALLGRNESGKSNLLLALRTLNPAEGFKALNPTKDFPRHRRLTECTDDTEVVSSYWKLTTDEQKELAEILPRASTVTQIQTGRGRSQALGVFSESSPPRIRQSICSKQNYEDYGISRVAGENLEEGAKRISKLPLWP